MSQETVCFAGLFGWWECDGFGVGWCVGVVVCFYFSFALVRWMDHADVHDGETTTIIPIGGW